MFFLPGLLQPSSIEAPSVADFLFSGQYRKEKFSTIIFMAKYCKNKVIKKTHARIGKFSTIIGEKVML